MLTQCPAISCLFAYAVDGLAAHALPAWQTNQLAQTAGKLDALDLHDGRPTKFAHMQC
jgi:hypothetical protein